ncbi:MAG: DHHA1 domain-containing protein, partial [bacterium]
EIEFLVNSLIMENYPLQVKEMPLDQAKKEGIIAIFGEKYKDPVRAIIAGPSRELCGGTHVERTGDIGYFLIVQETGVGSNLRRIEALTGEKAVRKSQEERERMNELSLILNSPQGQEVIKLKKLIEEKDEERKKALFYRDRYLKTLAMILKEQASPAFPYMVAKVEPLDMEALTALSDLLLRELGQSMVILGSIYEGKPLMLVRVSSDLVKKGWNAGEIAQVLGKILEGSGGGKPEMGRAGGKKADMLDEALKEAKKILKNADLSS